MDKHGKAAYVVVGVGGLLGLGEKDVAIPFDKVKFSQEPMPQATAPAGNTQAPGTMTPMAAPGSNGGGMGAPAANTGMAPNSSVGLGSPVATNNAGGTGAGQNPPPGDAMTTPMSPRSSAYPDHGMIDYTADQLKAAPAFTYAK